MKPLTAPAKRIGQTLAVMAAVWPKFELSEQTIEVYIAMLADVPVQALEMAAKHLITTSPFFPSIAEWRSAAFDLLGEAAPTAGEAWAEVMQQIEHTGNSAQPHFSHPLIQKTVTCIGWRTLCLSEQIVYERGQFCKLYDELRQRAQEKRVMLPEVRRMVEAAGDKRSPAAQMQPGQDADLTPLARHLRTFTPRGQDNG